MVSFKQEQGFPEYAHSAGCIKISDTLIVQTDCYQ